MWKVTVNLVPIFTIIQNFENNTNFSKSDNEKKVGLGADKVFAKADTALEN